MCFSLEASFTSGIVLSFVGIIAIKKSETKAQIIFSSIPFIFAVQQITEGFVWLSLIHASYAAWQIPSTYLFLMFAQVVWPSWVPLSVLFLEKEKKRRKLLYVLSIIGLFVSTLLAIRLMTENIESEIQEHHILYKFMAHSSTVELLGVLYVISTVVPPFISSVKRMTMLGIIILISYIITKLFYTSYIISVWCFLAAIMSAAVYFIIRDLVDSSRKA